MQRLVGVGVGILHHHLFPLLSLRTKRPALFEHRPNHILGVLMRLKVEVQVSANGFNARKTREIHQLRPKNFRELLGFLSHRNGFIGIGCRQRE